MSDLEFIADIITQERANGIRTGAGIVQSYLLGWLTADDGLVSVARVKQGLDQAIKHVHKMYPQEEQNNGG